MSKPIIEVNGLSKRYQLGQFGFSSFRDEVERFTRRLRGKAEPAGMERPAARDFWALQDVSFAINPGEVVGVIGRNGAGKSTLLKLLSRITEPTAGEIVMRGRVASLLEVGTGFHPELSGRENVFLNGAILGMKRAEIARKFDEIVAFAEIEQFIDTPVKRYSSGMYVRLAFAVAAHLEPEILIVDEVLAVGDAAFQAKCIGRMREISSGMGRTVFFVSHSMATVRRLCQRCLMLDQGRSLGVLPTEKAIEYYNCNIAPSSMDIDVSQRKRDWGTTAADARILRVRSLNTKGLFFSEPLDIELTIQVNRPFDAMMVGLAFNTVEGQRVLTLDTDSGQKTWKVEPGLYKIRLGLPRLALSPGQYHCSASIGQGRYICDIIDGFAFWEVHPGINDNVSDRGYGGCREIPVSELTAL